MYNYIYKVRCGLVAADLCSYFTLQKTETLPIGKLWQELAWNEEINAFALLLNTFLTFQDKGYRFSVLGGVVPGTNVCVEWFRDVASIHRRAYLCTKNCWYRSCKFVLIVPDTSSYQHTHKIDNIAVHANRVHAGRHMDSRNCKFLLKGTGLRDGMKIFWQKWIVFV